MTAYENLQFAGHVLAGIILVAVVIGFLLQKPARKR